MTPDGGPVDTLPPVIVNITPENYSTNFASRKIYIEFDEFVQLKDQSKQFYTSPQMPTKPKLTIRGRGVVVTLGDSLAPNTTYALNFGSSIQDNNESNPLYSMRYVFSTGAEIDSMIVSGYAEDSFSADSVSGAFIYFFPADSVEYNADYDSVMFNYTPAVIARAENNGIFLAQNLKPIDYRVYAFEDRDDNFMYEPATDQIAFLDATYNPMHMPDFSLWFDSIRGYVVAEPQLQFKLFEDVAFKRQSLRESQRLSRHQARLYFGASNPEIESIVFDSIPQGSFFIEPQSSGRDTLSVWFDVEASMLPDTIRGEINYYKHDSLRNFTLSSEPLRLVWRYVETKEEAKEREKLEREREKAIADGKEWVEPQKDNPFKVTLTPAGEINPLKPLTMTFEYPLVAVDTTAITLRYIMADSTYTEQPFRLERDSLNFKLWRIYPEFAGRRGSYRLTLPKDVLGDVARQSNDSLSFDYTLYDPSKFSNVNIKFLKKEGDAADYIIELLDGSDKRLDYVVVSESGEVNFRYVPAGDIRIRLVEDVNRDGVRSSGSLVNRLAPERVAYYDRDGETTFQTKVNWDFDFEVEASKLFVDEDMPALIRRLETQERRRIEEELKENANPFKSRGSSHDHDHNH